jgi:hypothetical protein
LLKDIIKGYKESKIAIIQRFSGSEGGIYDETNFLDDGYIRVSIDRLKKEHSEIDNEIEILMKYTKQDSSTLEKQQKLIMRKQEIRLEMAFLASNNLSNIDSCMNLIEELSTDFKLCLIALRYYDNRDNKKAFEAFYEYFKDRTVLLEHYLINKVYGVLLYNLKQFDLSIALLRKAAEKRPEDIEVHRILRDIYSITNRNCEENIELSIIRLLEGK